MISTGHMKLLVLPKLVSLALHGSPPISLHLFLGAVPKLLSVSVLLMPVVAMCGEWD